MTRFRPGTLLITLARTAEQAPPYCLSFTAVSLRPELATVIAQVHLEQGDWRKTKTAVLARNALHASSDSIAKRLESELCRLLQCGPHRSGLMSWSELKRLVAEAENEGAIRRALKHCRSKQELVLAARRLGYRITWVDIQRAREEDPNQEAENRSIRTSSLEG